MSTIPEFGTMISKGDYWELMEAQTQIGSVDITFDDAIAPSSTKIAEISEVLSSIQTIDEIAQKYLAEYSPTDIEKSRGLKNPSIIFNLMPQNFTIFYSPVKENMDLTFGVEFVDKRPIDGIIGS